MAKSIAKTPSSELDETNKTIKFLDSYVRNYRIDSIQYESGSYTFIFKGFKTISDLSSNLCVVYTDGSVDAFPKFEDGYIKFTSKFNTFSLIERYSNTKLVICQITVVFGYNSQLL